MKKVSLAGDNQPAHRTMNLGLDKDSHGMLIVELSNSCGIGIHYDELSWPVLCETGADPYENEIS